MAMRPITLRDVTATIALFRTSVYVMMAESPFSKPIGIGRWAVCWVEQEVLDFIASPPRAGLNRLIA